MEFVGQVRGPLKTLPCSPSSRGAVEMLCLVEPQGCRKELFVDVGPIWSSLFSDCGRFFRSAAARITRTIVFGAQLRSRPTKLLASDSRFSNYVSRYRGCGRGARSKRDTGTNHTRNSERLRERERSARNVAKSKELASSRFNVLTLRPFTIRYGLRGTDTVLGAAAASESASAEL
jgi:hypothetical protein